MNTSARTKDSGEAAASWDYIIVGAGSAGCVLADRLSEDGRSRVLLIEAGGDDRSPFVAMPRGAPRLWADPDKIWLLPTEAHGDVRAETWMRGRILGGSSAVNGMMYFRGQREDYDGWEALGAEGWGWDEMAKAFRAMERHELGGDDVRGGSGPLGVSIEENRTPLSEAFIQAGEQMGVPRVVDLNRSSEQGVGYATRTIWRGRRQSAAQTFLKRARGRSNLRVMTGAMVDKVLFEDGRASGVAARVNGKPQTFRARGEVIISAGALMSPQILQRSGIGAGALLRELGIEVVADSPGVGEHMLEHRLLMVQYELTGPHSQNLSLQGARLIGNAIRYFISGGGPLAAAYGAVGAFVRVLPDAATPDVEILCSPAVGLYDAKRGLVPDKVHSIEVFGYPLRSRSEGWVRIASADPLAPARIHAGYLTDPYDCAVTVAMHRYIRRWMQRPAIAPFLALEREPSRSLQTDEEILHGYRSFGGAGYHACGTCRMGGFNDAVLDPQLRVRGVAGLRVIDGSIMPAMVSANTNGPIMASAWRAASLVLEARRT